MAIKVHNMRHRRDVILREIHETQTAVHTNLDAVTEDLSIVSCACTRARFTRVCDSPARRFVCSQPRRQPSAKAQTISQRCARGHSDKQQSENSMQLSISRQTPSKDNFRFLINPHSCRVIHLDTSLKINHISRVAARSPVCSPRAL